MKIKNILIGITGLATVSTIVAPLTSCSKNDQTSNISHIVATADTKVSITLGLSPKNVANKLQISTNGTEFKDVTEDTEITVEKGESLYFRGNNPDGVGGQNVAHTDGMHLLITSVDGSQSPCCQLMGSVMSLIDNGAGTAKAAPDHAFCYLFGKTGKEWSTGITTVSSNFLPATSVGDHAYQRMFNNAKNLTNAPLLPAETLSKGAYEHMFSGCSSLTETPELKLKEVPDYGYQSMFNECSGITKVGKIHATTLGMYACDNMFCDNKALKIKETTDLSDPNLFFTCPNKTTGSYAVNQMFGGCGETPTKTPVDGRSYAWFI